MPETPYTHETLADLPDKYPDGPSHTMIELFADAWKADAELLALGPRPDANGDWDVGEMMAFCDDVHARME